MTPLERRSVGSLALLYSFRMIGLFMVLPLLALYAVDLPGASASLIGLALGIYGLTQALLQVPLGWLSDQLGRKTVIVGGLCLLALGSVIAAEAESIYGIIAGRMLQGAGAIASTVMALVADLTREEQRTKAMALVGISIGLAFAVALILGPLLASIGGLSLVFWFTAALAVGGIGIVLLLVPAASPHRGDGEVDARVGLIGRSLRNPALLRLNLGVFVLHSVLMACFLVVPGYLEQSAGIDRDHHWQVYLPVLILSVVGMVPMMAVAERGGRPRQMFLLGVALVFIAVAALGFSSIQTVFYGALWLFFVGFNFLEATLPSLVSRTVFPGGRGTAMGLYSTCQFLGVFSGGAGGGWLLQHFGREAMMGLCLALLALWWLVALLTPQPAGAPAAGNIRPSET